MPLLLLLPSHRMVLIHDYEETTHLYAQFSRMSENVFCTVDKTEDRPNLISSDISL